MIISHQHRFIFFAVPKTATHTIREALRKTKGPDDWEQQTLFGSQVLPIPEIARLQHGHITAQQIRPHLDADVWDQYLKFGFVRNPFDRFVSTCFFLNRNKPNFAGEAVPFMKTALSRPRFRNRVLVKPQYLQLIDASGEIALDFVGRYESLQASYDVACDRAGIPAENLGRKNTSEHRHFTDYYDDELRELVADFYKDDLQLFDYVFSPSGPTK